MQQLSYASRCLVTPDAVSAALLDLVASLEPRQRAQIVTIPVLTEDGRLVDATVLLHAGSELVSVASEPAEGFPDAAVADAVLSIRSLIRNRVHAVEYPAVEDEAPASAYEEPYV